MSSDSKLISFVEKEIIIEKDLVMSGQVYKSNIDLNNSETVTLEDCTISIKNGKNFNQSDEGNYAVSRIETIAHRVVNFEKVKYTDDEPLDESFLDKGDILFSHINSAAHIGKVAYFDSDKKLLHGINLLRIKADNKKIMPKFLYFVLNSKSFVDSIQGFVNKAVNQASINITNLKKIQIPLPPLEKQQEIVDEIEQYQKVIDGARQAAESSTLSIQIDNNLQLVELDNLAEFIRGVTFSSKDRKESPNSKTINIATTKAAQADGIVEKDLYFIDKSFIKNNNKLLMDGDILISLANSLNLVGRTTFVENLQYELSFGAFMGCIRPDKEKIKPIFLFAFLNSNFAKKYYLNNARTTTNISNLSFESLKKLKIPLPTLKQQEKIETQLNLERENINSFRSQISIYNDKINSIIENLYN